MRQITKLLACGAILAAITPVVAQAHEVPSAYSQGGYNGGGDWNNGGATYDQFTQEYDHIAQMIRHAANDGTLNSRQIAGSWNELRYIRRLAYAQQQRGYYNPQIIQARLTRLHEGLHLRHDAGHSAQEQYGNDSSRYGYSRHDDASRPGDYGRHDDHEHNDNEAPH